MFYNVYTNHVGEKTLEKHEPKTLNVFFESAFEDLSFHSFLKASD